MIALLLALLVASYATSNQGSPWGVTVTSATFIDGGTDPIDGDKLEITDTYDNFTPTTTGSQATATDQLGAILEGIDDALATAGVTDHGALTGLADDDHTQYLELDGSDAVTGDMAFNEDITMADNKQLRFGDGTWGLMVDDALKHLNFYYSSAEDANMFVDIDTGVVATNSLYGTNIAGKDGVSAPVFPQYLKTDQIDEENSAAGVTVDGVTLKDGAITLAGNVDGRDVSADGAALDLIDLETLLLDGTRAMTGNLNMGSQAITSVGNVDGRDVSADGTKLDGIEALADVTDATNVNAAGAVMESDVSAKGQIFVATASSTLTALAVGSNNQVLTADSAEASGVKWAAAAGGGILGYVNWDASSMFPCDEASDRPTGTDGFAPVVNDATNPTIKAAAFDDTADECRHRTLYVPPSTATINISINTRAETCSSCGTTASVDIWCRELTGTPGSWTLEETISVAPTDTTWMMDTGSITISGSVLAADSFGQCTVTRDGDGTNGTDSLTDDLYFDQIAFEFE